MGLIFECISFIVGIFSFLLTIATFVVACRVNHKVLRLRESEKFHLNRREILNELDGYIRSIQNDHLYKSDSKKTLLTNILLQLADIETKYTHLSKKTRKHLKNAKNNLKCPSINWLDAAQDLIALKNSIEKEI